METDFRVVVTREGLTDIVRFSGIIDSRAENALRELADGVNGPNVRCDFSDSGRINSMGIAFLLRFMKQIRDDKSARITIRGLSQVNTILFKMTGIFLLATVEQ
ncbi:MAG: STAS domain-containing protein [Desulfuromonadales bacterium]|nr:MAG: STAS domain-containing protein [Desulfuromonadales bacterium]